MRPPASALLPALLAASCNACHQVWGARPIVQPRLHTVTALADPEPRQTRDGEVDSQAETFRDVASPRNQVYERAKQRAREEWQRTSTSRSPGPAEQWSTEGKPGQLSDSFSPGLASSGVSGVLGFCSGKVCRVAGDAAALGLGAAFVFVSLLSKAGYVTINYDKVERDLLTLLDLNKGTL